MINEVPVDSIRRICNSQLFEGHTSQEVAPLENILGQERAVKALQFGLEIKGLGFNTYVAGMPGTGKETAIKRFLEEVAEDKPVPDDWCYVNNFSDPYCPRSIRFPAGQAKEFQTDMRELVLSARQDIRSVFDSDEYAAKREETIKAIQRRKEALLSEINERVRTGGFLIQSTPLGIATIPLKDGKPITDEQFLGLSSAERQEMLERQGKLQGELKTVLRQMKSLDKAATRQLEALDREVALFALNHLFEDLEEKYEIGRAHV